jgi:hypothetical protein
MLAAAPVAAAIGAAIALAACGAEKPASPPERAHPPFSLLQEQAVLMAEPVRTLQVIRSLGVDAVRVGIGWSSIAADARSRRRPAGDPYPAKAFGVYDTLDRAAAADGIELDFLLTGSAPEWALAKGDPAQDAFHGAWKPSAEAFARFVQVVATRYDGHYTPAGESSPLPAIHFWELWNEPNWGPSLEPQFELHPLRNASASEYRQLLDAAWSGLVRTGHAHDTVVIGNLSPRGAPGPPPSPVAALTWNTSPVGFTHTLYCVDRFYRPLRGQAAALVGCPATPAGSREFRAQHPVLFEATGYGIHPYPINLPPTKSDTTNPDTVEFSQIPHLESVLDRLHGVYGSNRHMDIYNTEYGYITNPPNTGTEYLRPAQAAIYLNWAEYLTWRNPRIANAMQFGLYDADIKQSVFGPGGFSSSLIAYTGVPKATFYAYRMPIFLPVTSAPSGSSLEVWGCARPAPYAYQDTHRTQSVQIQFRPERGQRFSTVRTVRLNPAYGCYFDVAVKFPASGTVRLKWSYPRDDPRLLDPATPGQTTIYSRLVSIKMS